MIRNRTQSEPQDRPPDTTDADVYVLCDGAVGASVARLIREDGRSVTLVDESSETVDAPAGQVETSDVSALADAELDDRSTVIVATSSDARNLLLAQRLRARSDVYRVVVLTNTPDLVEAIAAAGHEPLCATTVLASALADSV